MSNLRPVRHLGFDRKQIFTTARPSGTVMYQHVKFHHNPPMFGWVIDYSTNFPVRVSGGSNEQVGWFDLHQIWSAHRRSIVAPKVRWVTSLFGLSFAETKDWDQNSVWDRRSAKSEVDFYSRRNSLLFRRLYMPWSDPSVRLSVCPSVLPSHSGVLSRRMKLRSCGFHRQVGHSS